MELDRWEIVLGHLQHIVGIGKENVASLPVKSHELMFAFLEGCESLGIVAFNPACLIERKGLPAALCAIFVEKSILDYLELQLSYGSYNLTAVELIGEQLRHAFVHQLLYAFLKLLGFHGVGVLYVFEHLGREAWKAFEVQ